MTKRQDGPDAQHIIALRLMHQGCRGLTNLQKAQEIINDLRVHGFAIVTVGEPVPQEDK